LTNTANNRHIAFVVFARALRQYTEGVRLYDIEQKYGNATKTVGDINKNKELTGLGIGEFSLLCSIRTAYMIICTIPQCGSLQKDSIRQDLPNLLQAPILPR